MSSLIPGYEYDIFISYRHKDNKYDGWVTDFVANLNREIGATFKEDIRVYFDSNSYDGLLETHNVDKSLEAKLKSVVFIPIISQTYCDTRSFAWQNEFVVFNALSKGDMFGRDIRLANGNVASRILPVKIHDLDIEDNMLLEKELSGPLRAIEFIFKSAGVNRPLRADDKREDNLNRLFYRDQINKVANAAKEIMYGMRFPGRKQAEEPKRAEHREAPVAVVPIPVAEKKHIVNPEANDLFLKGRHALNLWNVDGYRAATGYFKQAIAKDPEFIEAYSYLATSYVARMSWNGDLSPDEAEKNIDRYLNESWKRGPSDNDYLTKAYVEFFVKKDFASAEKLLKQVIDMAPANTTALYTYSYLLNMMGRFEEALNVVYQAKAIDPLSVSSYYYQTMCLYLFGKTQDALNNVLEAARLYPSVLRIQDFLARIYLSQGRNEDAIEVISSSLAASKIRPPSMVAWLALAYTRLKKDDKAKELTEELIERSETGDKGVNIYLVHVFGAKGDLPSVKLWLENAKESNDVDLVWWQVDPLLKKLKSELPGT
ncbi:MAG: tetratricopeptide repeat protein [Bacteroidota bacterium]